MSIDRLVLAFAGSFILVSLALSQLHSPYWLWFTAFVGANMLQAAFSGFCPLAKILKALGKKAQSEIYSKSSIDLAMRDAFRKTRNYLMTEHALSEDEAISLISVAVDFGITQVVDGNLGVHAIIRKATFPDYERRAPKADQKL